MIGDSVRDVLITQVRDTGEGRVWTHEEAASLVDSVLAEAAARTAPVFAKDHWGMHQWWCIGGRGCEGIVGMDLQTADAARAEYELHVRAEHRAGLPICGATPPHAFGGSEMSCTLSAGHSRRRHSDRSGASWWLKEEQR